MKPLLLAVLCVLGTSTAWAAPPDPSVQRAVSHFQRGKRAYDAGDFDKAVTEYKAAYDAKPDPAFLFNIAQSYRLGNYVGQALYYYRFYLKSSPGPHPDVDARIKQLESLQAPPPPPPAPEPPKVELAPQPMVVTTPIEPPPQRTPKPAYKKGWVWGTVVAVVLVAGAGVGVGLGLTLGRDPKVPSSDLGNNKVFALKVSF